ncbi:MAG: class I SAM-dependent methyltransferase [Gemmatimonadetes bacterium]|nr:class I SAM-dependent methyltransferase [Gemmatimonadota bacterium]
MSAKAARVGETANAFSAEEDRIRAAYARRVVDGRYSWFDAGNLLAMHERERSALRVLAAAGLTPLAERRILEVGCGTGAWLRDFVKWGADPKRLYGVDLLSERVEQARRLCPAGVTLECRNAAQLGFEDASFDLLLQSTVFTSILDRALRRAVAAEMVRVLRPGGVILWYDYHVNNPRNPDVRGVPRREIAELFPGCSVHLRPVTLAPPLARMLAPRAWLLCQLLERVPGLRTHYLGLIRKPAPGATGR